jgi:hypothetical protein
VVGALGATVGTVHAYQHSSKNACYQAYAGGSIEWIATSSSTVQMHELHGAIYKEWAALGFETSPLGLPVTDESSPTISAISIGRFNDFENGSIYWSPTTGVAREILTPIRDQWLTLMTEPADSGFVGGYAVPQRVFLGFPLTDDITTSTASGAGDYNRFEHGAIYSWNRFPDQSAIYEVHGPIYDRWASEGYEQGSHGFPMSDVMQINYCLGLPRCDPSGESQGFEHGDIAWTPTHGTHPNRPEVWNIWIANAHCLGLPVDDGDPASGVQQFERGTVHFTPGGAAWTAGCRGASGEVCFTDGTCDAPSVCHYDGLCGQATTCGELNQPPCFTQCDDELQWNWNFTNGRCIPSRQPCGYGEQPCCDGQCRDSSLACSNGTCVQAGFAGEPCLPQDWCLEGSVCDNVLASEGIPGYQVDSRCTSPPVGWSHCGGDGEICCTHLLNECSDANAVCFRGTCQPCGNGNQPCCANNHCNDRAICGGDGRCAPCGGGGEVCCPGQSCNVPLQCNSDNECVPQPATTCRGYTANNAAFHAIGVKDRYGCAIATVIEYANSLAEAHTCAFSAWPNGFALVDNPPAARQRPVAEYPTCSDGSCECDQAYVSVFTDDDYTTCAHSLCMSCAAVREECCPDAISCSQ